MNKKTILLIGFLFQAVILAAQTFDISKELPVDPSFVIGKLDNGLTYYIKESKLSENRADFFIAHNVGSLQEEENQRGLAHFLEHMAFNGTKHFPNKQLLSYFESIGVRFGANVNAYTSMSRTVYNISEVPVNRSTVIDTALLALHDWSHYINCLPEEIESERGVVREEMRRGDDPLTRTMQAISQIQRTGSMFANRLPIGTAEVIENFKHRELIDFYHKWYRPSLQAVIIVGDIDAKDIEKRIIERFSTIPRPKNEAEKTIYTIPDNVEPIVGYFTDPETKASSVRMTIKIPHRSIEERQTEAFIYDQIVYDLFREMFSARCVENAKATDADYRFIIPVFGEIDYACKTFTATAMPAKGKDLQTALRGILTEVERVRQHGITNLELDNAKRIVRANIRKQQSDQGRPKANKDLISYVVDNFTRNRPLVDQTELLKLSGVILDKIQIEDINANIEQILNSNNRIIIFAAPESEKESLPSEQEVLSLVDKMQNAKYEQYTPVAQKDLELSSQIIPGKIIESKKITSKDLGIDYKIPLDSTTELRLDNGARIIWKESYDGGKQIRLSAFTPGGYARNNSIEELILLKNFMRYYNASNLNWNDLKEWKHTNGIRLSQAVNKRTDNYSGNFYPQNSENFFKLLYTHFDDVSVDETDLIKFKQQYLKAIGEEKNEGKLFADSVRTLTYLHDPIRTKFDTLTIESLSIEKLENLYNEHFSNAGEFTFIFIGPMPVEKAAPMIEKYIGSIKTINREDKKLQNKDQALNKGVVELYYTAENTISTKASVAITYHANVDYNAVSYVNTLFLRDVLSRRCYNSIREERGGTYHVGVTAGLTKYPSPQLSLDIEFSTNPAMVSELLEVAKDEAEQLAKKGPTKTEIEEIRKYRLKALDKKIPTPWANIITQAILNDDFLDTTNLELYENVDAKSVHKLAKKLFNSGNIMTFVFDPQ